MGTSSARRRATPSLEERVARRAERATARQADIDADPLAAARQICLDQLATSARTRVQLERVLARKGIPEEAARTVLDRYTEIQLIDDGAYAAAYVEARQRGHGRRSLAHGLRQRGVGEELVAAATAVVDETTEREAARVLVRRKLAGLRGQPPEVAVRRLAGMLARKGFPPGITFEVVRAELAADGADAEELLAAQDVSDRD